MCRCGVKRHAAGQLDVLGHDGHALGVDGTQVEQSTADDWKRRSVVDRPVRQWRNEMGEAAEGEGQEEEEDKARSHHAGAQTPQCTPHIRLLHNALQASGGRGDGEGKGVMTLDDWGLFWQNLVVFGRN